MGLDSIEHSIDQWTAATRETLRLHLRHLRIRIDSTPVPPTAAASALRILHDGHRRHLADLVTGLDRQLDTGTEADALRELATAVRAAYGLVAGFQGSAEWHSPPLRATMPSDRCVGPAVTDHDYRRDRCPAVSAFETVWLSESVYADPGWAEPRLAALAFTSGMAAIATTLSMLATIADSSRSRFLVADSIYHETAILLSEGPLRHHVDWFPASEPRRLTRMLHSAGEAPVVMVDAQSNGFALETTDHQALAETLARRTPRSTLVIDATMTSIRCQPFLQPPDQTPRLILMESLTKFAQLGQDRVAGGIVVTDSETARSLDRWREHMGTTAVAAVVRQLPPPTATVRLGRLRRHEANARQLAGRLAPALASFGLSVVGPQPTSPTGNRPTVGSMLVIQGWPMVLLDEIVDRLVCAATSSGVPIAQGTSFGFDTTRISVVSSPPCRPGATGEPFVRIAVGCGPRPEIADIGRLLVDVVTDLGRRAEPPVNGSCSFTLRGQVDIGA